CILEKQEEREGCNESAREDDDETGRRESDPTERGEAADRERETGVVRRRRVQWVESEEVPRLRELQHVSPGRELVRERDGERVVQNLGEIEPQGDDYYEDDSLAPARRRADETHRDREENQHEAEPEERLGTRPPEARA